MKTIIGIPARMGSTRFPGKPLAKILGMPMIEHVYKRCKLALYHINDEVFVATCDDEIKETVENFGGKVYMTPKDISRPGLRVAEACRQIDLDDNDIIVIVQGDEPLVNPKMIDIAIEPLIKNDVYCVNLASDMTEEEWNDPNEIKVVTDLKMNTIFMSRSPIPSNTRNCIGPRMKQICVMPFRKKDLLHFQSLEPTPLEKVESIEMLRAIEHGFNVRMVKTDMITKSVDNEDDRKIVEELMKEDYIYKKYGY